MAERRMFSKKIINSARFLKMPLEAQALYFHLGLNADDDGVVEAFNVIRCVSASEDSLKLLVAKNFVQVLNDDLVSFILDWSEHNSIRADRKVDSIYKELLLKVNPGLQLVAPRQRADGGRTTTGQPADNHGTTMGQPADNRRTTAGQLRIVQDRIGQDNIFSGNKATTTKKASLASLEEIRAYVTQEALSVDAERFFAYYEANGWKVGRNPMQSWQATLRSWHLNHLNAVNSAAGGGRAGGVGQAAASGRKETLAERNERVFDALFERAKTIDATIDAEVIS